jgi:hypothetical protein
VTPVFSGGDLDDEQEEEEEEEEESSDESDGEKGGSGLYNPSDYAHLDVSSEIKDLFQYIQRYKPQKIDLETRLKPFIPGAPPPPPPPLPDSCAYSALRLPQSVRRLQSRCGRHRPLH